jgi:CRP/FNR family transcriptional regulator, cyclic AMP receptor protein
MDAAQLGLLLALRTYRRSEVMAVDATLFQGVKLFEMLDDDERRLLAEVVDLAKLTRGETLFKAGETGDALFVVSSGAVELYVQDNVGQKIVLTIAGPGDVFGEVALLDAGPRTATAVALEDSELVMLDRDDLHLLFHKKPDAALHMLAAMGAMTRKADALLRSRVSRNANEEIAEHLTIIQKVSDWIAWFSGSMYFLAMNTVWFGGWIAVNTLPMGVTHFDPYPFGLLTMIVSLEAIFLSIFVLISQNRQAQKDRVRSDIEYEINVKAELEVAHLHEKTDRLHEDLVDRLTRLERALVPGSRGSGR